MGKRTRALWWLSVVHAKAEISVGALKNLSVTHFFGTSCALRCARISTESDAIDILTSNKACHMSHLQSNQRLAEQRTLEPCSYRPIEVI
jgi:hypothetical protein